MPKKPILPPLFAADTIDLGSIEVCFRNQALKDVADAAKAQDYTAAARWQAWADAYNHLLTTVRSQRAVSKHRGEG